MPLLCSQAVWGVDRAQLTVDRGGESSALGVLPGAEPCPLELFLTF